MDRRDVWAFARWPLALLLLADVAIGEPEPTAGRGDAPAAVERPVQETDLANVRLTSKAEQRLGIATGMIDRRPLRRVRMFGGEVVAPPVADDHGGRWVGDAGQRGQTIFSIVPALAPTELIRVAEAQIDADGQVERAKVELEATRVALQRAARLLRERAGPARAVDEARTQVGIAEAALHTAQARRALLGPPVLALVSPSKIWIRVPVYVGDLAALRVNQEAQVGGLTDTAGTQSRAATPVAGPPSANPAAATVDVFYALANEDGAFRLGEKVGVSIPLQQEQDAVVVPWSAVVHDIYGGTWVYEAVSPHGFARRRVQVAFVAGDEAALDSGPPPGTRVVVRGAAQLFGIELGFGTGGK